jgi:hypothetical protein
VKLRSLERPRAKQGKSIFIISIILIVPTVIIPVFWMYNARWHSNMIEVMLADFIPIFLLSIISAVLAMFVNKRSLFNNNMNEINIKNIDLTGNINKGLSKYLIIGFIVFVIITMIFIFLFYLTNLLR